MFFLLLNFGNSARHPSTSETPSIRRKVESTRRDREKRGSSWIHPHSHEVYTRTFKERERNEEIRSLAMGRISNQQGCCLSIWKIKIESRKILRQQQVRQSWKWEIHWNKSIENYLPKWWCWDCCCDDRSSRSKTGISCCYIGWFKSAQRKRLEDAKKLPHALTESLHHEW